MKKRIGILGGISFTSTIEYYELLHQKYFERFSDYYYPEIVIYSLDFQKFTDFEDKGDRKGYIEYILSGIRALERAGVDFIILAANSPHAVFNEVKEQAKVKLLNIAEMTAKKAKKSGMQTLLLLGIKFTMQSVFYEEICDKYGIKVVFPSENEQNEINRIIFEELVIGLFNEESKETIFNIIENYEVDGVILGCTELPLLIKQIDTQIPLLNTLELHAEAALDYALTERT